MLKGVLKHGTAAGTLSSMARPAAGKTGTTDNKYDAWFVGFTPQYTAAVWMGDPAANTATHNVGGISVFGATYPAKIWRSFMEKATANLPPLDFTPPNTFFWPRPSFISEQGRRFTFGSSRNNGGGYVPTGPAPTSPPAPSPVTTPGNKTPRTTVKHSTPTTAKHTTPTTAGPGP
jgi:membrane peptidoglycan carboxypeptidase